MDQESFNSCLCLLSNFRHLFFQIIMYKVAYGFAKGFNI